MSKIERKAFEFLNKNHQIYKPIIEQYKGRLLPLYRSWKRGETIEEGMLMAKQAIEVMLESMEANNIPIRWFRNYLRMNAD